MANMIFNALETFCVIIWANVAIKFNFIGIGVLVHSLGFKLSSFIN